jgi:hypothetical protein
MAGPLSRHFVRQNCLTIFRGSAAAAAKKLKKIYETFFFNTMTSAGWTIVRRINRILCRSGKSCPAFTTYKIMLGQIFLLFMPSENLYDNHEAK